MFLRRNRMPMGAVGGSRLRTHEIIQFTYGFGDSSLGGDLERAQLTLKRGFVILTGGLWRANVADNLLSACCGKTPKPMTFAIRGDRFRHRSNTPSDLF
jgi:hypothetical protein